MALLEDVLPAIRLGKKITRLKWGWSCCVNVLSDHLEIPDKESILADDWIILEDCIILNNKLDQSLRDIRYIVEQECRDTDSSKALYKKITEIEELIPEEIL